MASGLLYFSNCKENLLLFVGVCVHFFSALDLIRNPFGPSDFPVSPFNTESYILYIINSLSNDFRNFVDFIMSFVFT